MNRTPLHRDLPRRGPGIGGGFAPPSSPAFREGVFYASVVAPLALAFVLFLPAPSAAQGTDSLALSQDRDVDRALSRAREAQEDFENQRRRSLPVNYGWDSGRCDARVGRMCWRHHALVVWRPRGEALAVVEARDSLLVELERDALAAPGDAWILGQRVWYLLEAARSAEALGLAEACDGPPLWWCSALEGLVLHLRGRYPDAEAAFDRGLQAMDPEEAQRWEDLDPLLDGGARKLLLQATESSPAEREALIQRAWDLADPLYLVPGNDRRTEHLARHTLAGVFSEAATPHRIGWGSDMSQLLVRYGWERDWERIPPRPGELGNSVRIVGFEHPDVRGFFPPEEILSRPTMQRSDPWVPSMSPVSRSGYAPAYAPVFLPMESRLLVLTRGDHALVAATYRLPPDTTYRTREGIRGPHMEPPAFLNWTVRAGLILAESGKTPLHARLESGALQGVLTLDVPAGAYLASVEVLDPAAGRAGRLRNGLRVRDIPPDLPVLSDLLLVEGDPLPQNTQEALERLEIDNEVQVGDPLGVGWEIWGLGWREETVHYRLTLEPTDPGLVDRFRRLFGGQSRFPTLEWEEPGPEEPGPAFLSVALDFPELEPGEYTLTLEVGLQGREPLVSRQRLRVVEAGGGPEGGSP